MTNDQYSELYISTYYAALPATTPVDQGKAREAALAAHAAAVVAVFQALIAASQTAAA